MKISRPLQYLLVATACASAYVAWIGQSGDPVDAPPSAKRQPPVASARQTLPGPMPAAPTPPRSVDLFAPPGWRLGAMTPSLEPFAEASPQAAAEPSRAQAQASMEAIAIWRDTRGVMIVLTLGEATRIACEQCTAPGQLRPGARWNGYRLDAVDASGATLTELSTGSRIHLGVPA